MLFRSNELLAYGEGGPVALKPFLEKLRQNLTQLYDNEASVKLLLEGDDLTADQEKATDIALVVNELVSNAFKHAFTGLTGGQVRVILKKGELFSSITVQDNGNGFDFNGKEGLGFGMSLVKMTVRDKLGGKLYLTSDREGTSVTFDFR